MKADRRHFLLTAGGLAAWQAAGPLRAALPSPAPVRKGRVLVAVFLRGGIDGLNLVVPHGDPHYYEHRRNIAIPRPAAGNRNSAIDLDGFFGLHPAAAALEPMFRQHSALALQAVGYARNTRSHFEEQDTWETGISGNTLSSDGWLNRHLASSEGHGTIRAVAIGGNLPRMLRGKAPAYAIRGIADLSMPKSPGGTDLLRGALEHAYCTRPPGAAEAEARDLLARTAAATLEGTRQLEAVANTEYKPAHGAKYPETAIARQFREAARLIKAGIGTEVIQIDYGGWDTHNNQGGLTGGYANRLRDLCVAMQTFARDLGDSLNDVLVLTLSDFGRTVRENGTNGTDHGWANCMLALGGGLATGKPVLGEWPGLAVEQLQQQRDLRHTTDFRDVLCEAVSAHLGNPHTSAVIPDHQAKAVGLFRPA